MSSGIARNLRQWVRKMFFFRFRAPISGAAEIRYKICTYFRDRGCVRTLRTLYVYATDRVPLNRAVVQMLMLIMMQCNAMFLH